jgi:hypothetical protein
MAYQLSATSMAAKYRQQSGMAAKINGVAERQHRVVALAITLASRLAALEKAAAVWLVGLWRRRS